jgi:hypothetical protein
MPRITRKRQKIFAKTASNIGQVGSAAANAQVLSADLDVLQALPAFENGLSSVTLGATKRPPLEEVNALDYIATTQLAYLFQEGMPEWDANTEYFLNSFVKQVGTPSVYESIVNSNIGNPISDTTKWRFAYNLDGSQKIGSTLTISAGAITGITSDVHAVTTAPIVNTLTNLINITGTFRNGQELTIKTLSATDSIQLVNTGNIRTSNGLPLRLTNIASYATLSYNGSTWDVINSEDSDKISGINSALPGVTATITANAISIAAPHIEITNAGTLQFINFSTSVFPVGAQNNYIVILKIANAANPVTITTGAGAGRINLTTVGSLKLDRVDQVALFKYHLSTNEWHYIGGNTGNTGYIGAANTAKMYGLLSGNSTTVTSALGITMNHTNNSGIYDVVFDTPTPNTGYIVQVTILGAASNAVGTMKSWKVADNRTVNGFSIHTYNPATSTVNATIADVSGLYVVIYYP